MTENDKRNFLDLMRFKNIIDQSKRAVAKKYEFETFDELLLNYARYPKMIDIIIDDVFEDYYLNHIKK